MRPSVRAVLLSCTAIAASCGGAAAPSTPPSSAAATVVASSPSPSAPPSASPSASPAPAYAGVGSASVKVTESKSLVAAAPAHVGFVGDEPSIGPGTYLETLNVVTLQPGGRTVSHKHAGVEWVFVIEGSVEVRMGAGGRVVLSTGQSGKVPANTPVQAFNTGTGAARFIALFVTAEGQPFQTNLETVP